MFLFVRISFYCLLFVQSSALTLPIHEARTNLTAFSVEASLDNIEDRWLSDLVFLGRRELTISLDFKHVFYGIWKVDWKRLYTANALIQEAMNTMDKGHGSKKVRADVLALIGIRSMLFPDGQVSRKEAVDILDTATRMNPNAQLTRLMLACEYGNIASSAKWANHYQQGVEEFRAHALRELEPLTNSGEPAAWLVQAAMHLLAGSLEHAASAARSALALAPTDAEVMDIAAQMLQRVGHELEASAVLDAGIAAGYWPARDQRPHVYWPKLPVLPPVLPRGRYPELDKIRSFVQGLLPRIRDDMIRSWKLLIQETLSNDFQKPRLLDPWKRFQGIWYEKKIYICSFGGHAPCDRELMPTLCDGLANLEGRVGEDAKTPLNCSGDFGTHTFPEDGSVRILQATLSVVAPPLTSIDWHSSSQHGRLRLQCPIHVPPGSESKLFFRGNASVTYQQWRCFWFDESREHSVEYRGSDYRVSVLIDVFHPGFRENNGETQDKVLRLEMLSEPYFAARLKGGV
eukprot:TRINITY_DN23960_c0_g1_i1.p1 TRINITY_DN23960_c0_g1~~TRINITY_DN23960_c0_g1_i1.p1  ORF type:complete len:516 (+),score=75.29 TRINITY_DN23960_c0_g1_i1:166-1713(+)